VQSEDDLEESVDLLPDETGVAPAAEPEREVEEDAALMGAFGSAEPQLEGANGRAATELPEAEVDLAPEVEPPATEPPVAEDPAAAAGSEAPVQPVAPVEDVETEGVPPVLEEPGPEPPAGLEGEGPAPVHEGAEMREDDAVVETEAEPEPAPAPKKRWSLFRRGGDR